MNKNIILESVENGYILRCNKVEKSKGRTFDMPIHRSVEYVYQEDQLDEAVEKMKELRNHNGKKGKEEEYED